jgi:multicomponent Na+:H+ antiporter subunit D
MITQASIDQGLAPVWYLLEAASAGVFLHAGIKFPWFVFFQKDSGMRPDEPPISMRAAMVIFAVLCIGLGVAPGALYALLPYPVDYVPYTVSHVVTMLQLLLFSGLAFFVLLPMMKRTETISLDLDWFYRSGFPLFTKGVMAVITPIDRGIRSATIKFIDRAIATIFHHTGPQGLQARTWSVGGMVAWMILLLGLYLVLNFTSP